MAIRWLVGEREKKGEMEIPSQIIYSPVVLLGVKLHLTRERASKQVALKAPTSLISSKVDTETTTDWNGNRLENISKLSQ